jgi:hypothetical protein
LKSQRQIETPVRIYHYFYFSSSLNGTLGGIFGIPQLFVSPCRSEKNVSMDFPNSHKTAGELKSWIQIPFGERAQFIIHEVLEQSISSVAPLIWIWRFKLFNSVHDSLLGNFVWMILNLSTGIRMFGLKRTFGALVWFFSGWELRWKQTSAGLWAL